MSDKKKTPVRKQLPPPSKELLASCRKGVGIAMSSAVKNLFDDETNGGDFYAHILTSMDRIYDDPRIPTAAVSITNKLNLYISSYFFVHVLAQGLNEKNDNDKKLLQQRRAAVIKHEILHAIFHHMSRGMDFSNQQLANIAADLVVNSHIDKAILGEDFLYAEKFNLPKDQTLDYYYQNFPIKQHPVCQDPNGHDKQYQGNKQGGGQGQDQKKDGKGKDKKQGQGQGDQQGQGQGDKQEGKSGQGQPGGSGSKGDQNSQDHEHGPDGEPCDHSGECDHDHNDQNDQQPDGDHSVDENGNCKVCGGLRTFDNHSVWSDDGGDQISDQMKESLVRDAISKAADATKNAGRLPQAVQDMIALAKKKPQVPWQQILRQFVSKLSNGELNHTKKRVSKRFKSRPGIKIRPKLKIAVPIDVSGSISEQEYETFINEIFAIAKHTGEVEVVEWDVGVRGTYKIKGYKRNITRLGRGGTDPTEAIKWVNDRRHKFDGAIFFTDGHFCINEVVTPLRIPTLFVITQTGSTEAVKKHRKIKLPKSA